MPAFEEVPRGFAVLVKVVEYGPGLFQSSNAYPLQVSTVVPWLPVVLMANIDVDSKSTDRNSSLCYSSSHLVVH